MLAGRRREMPEWARAALGVVGALCLYFVPMAFVTILAGPSDAVIYHRILIWAPAAVLALIWAAWAGVVETGPFRRKLSWQRQERRGRRVAAGSLGSHGACDIEADSAIRIYQRTRGKQADAARL